MLNSESGPHFDKPRAPGLAFRGESGPPPRQPVVDPRLLGSGIPALPSTAIGISPQVSESVAYSKPWTMSAGGDFPEAATFAKNADDALIRGEEGQRNNPAASTTKSYEGQGSEVSRDTEIAVSESHMVDSLVDGGRDRYDIPEDAMHNETDTSHREEVALSARKGLFTNEDGHALTAYVFDSPKVGVNTNTRIIVNGEDLGVAADVTTLLGQALQESDKKEAAGNGVDCYAFGMMLGGGTVNGAPKDVYTGDNIRTNYNVSFITPTEGLEVAVLPSMQPLALGKLNPNGSFATEHVVVKLPETNDGKVLYVGKLGGKEVVMTDLDNIAEFYNATHIGPFRVAEAIRRDTGETIFEFYKKEGEDDVFDQSQVETD